MPQVWPKEIAKRQKKKNLSWKIYALLKSRENGIMKSHAAIALLQQLVKRAGSVSSITSPPTTRFWIFLFVGLFFGCICSMWTFPGQGWNPHYISDPGWCSDKAESLTHCTTRELWPLGYFETNPNIVLFHPSIQNVFLKVSLWTHTHNTHTHTHTHMHIYVHTHNIKHNTFLGVPVMVQWKRSRLGTMRLQVQSLATLSGLRIWHCCELWRSLGIILSEVSGLWDCSCGLGE